MNLTSRGSRFRAPSRAIRAGHRNQRGLTLIETIVALAVIAIGVVGIAYGFSAVARSARDAQEQATLDTAAQAAADYLQSSLAYDPCDSRAYGTPYTLAGLTTPNGVTSWAIASVVESPAGSLTRSTPPATADYSSVTPIQACSRAVDDYGIQQIQIQVCDAIRCVTQTVWKADDTLTSGAGT